MLFLLSKADKRTTPACAFRKEHRVVAVRVCIQKLRSTLEQCTRPGRVLIHKNPPHLAEKRPPSFGFLAPRARIEFRSVLFGLCVFVLGIRARTRTR